MTNLQRRALEVLRDHGPQTASMVAQRLGYGERKGRPRSTQGLGRIGGNVLAALRRRFLVDWTWPLYRISDEGRAELRR